MTHKNLSLLKSGLRIGACIALLFTFSWIVFAILFLVAELLGIKEEFTNE